MLLGIPLGILLGCLLGIPLGVLLGCCASTIAKWATTIEAVSKTLLVVTNMIGAG